MTSVRSFVRLALLVTLPGACATGVASRILDRDGGTAEQRAFSLGAAPLRLLA